MEQAIKKVCVIGSGVMGAGIAAHLANAQIDVLLLDVKQSGLGQKNHLAQAALERLEKADPAPIMHKRNFKFITVGNIEDDLNKVKDYDWVIEVIVEKVDIKQQLYAKIDQCRGAKTIVSSNTSTIPLHLLTEGRSTSFQQHFLITHFFNPPRYMRLLEVIKGQQTQQDVYDRIVDFCDRMLGKGVVDCHDTPGFIANRIGSFWLQTAMFEAMDHGITVPEVDQIFGRAMGIPKTGVFGLIDLVGIDLMPLIAESMSKVLPATDAYVKNFRYPDLIKNMIAEGYTGRKGKGGFYRINKESGQKVKEVVNLSNGRYDPVSKSFKYPSLDLLKQGLVPFLNATDAAAQYAWRTLAQTLTYAVALVPEITDTIYNIDRAMKLGYNWKYGPFELIDRMGPAWFREKLEQSGYEIPALLKQVGQDKFYKIEQGQKLFLTLQGDYQAVSRPEGVLLLEDIKLRSKPVLKNGSAQAWDIGDQVLCFEFLSKQNAIDLELMTLLDQTIDLVQKDYKALVIYNEGSHFSVGVNLGIALFTANLAAFDMMADLVARGQEVYVKLKHAPFPVVAAPANMALGGGCEIVLHADAIQAHSETYMGLVEVGVGLVPAWGGCKEMMIRAVNENKGIGGSMASVGKVFEMIGTAKVAKSAAQAQDMLMMRKEDGITMSRDRLLYDAKQKALSLIDGYTPPESVELSLPGGMARVAFNMVVRGLVKAGKATAYDAEVAQKLAYILSGGDTDVTDKISEDEILKLERTAFMELARNPKTHARMEHILVTGKPLRN